MHIIKPKTGEEVYTFLREVLTENQAAELIYTYSNSYPQKRDFKVYPYSELNDNLLPGYRDYYNKYKDIVLSKTDVVKMKDI